MFLDGGAYSARASFCTLAKRVRGSKRAVFFVAREAHAEVGGDGDIEHESDDAGRARMAHDLPYLERNEGRGHDDGEPFGPAAGQEKADAFDDEDERVDAGEDADRVQRALAPKTDEAPHQRLQLMICEESDGGRAEEEPLDELEPADEAHQRRAPAMRCRRHTSAR